MTVDASFVISSVSAVFGGSAGALFTYLTARQNKYVQVLKISVESLADAKERLDKLEAQHAEIMKQLEGSISDRDTLSKENAALRCEMASLKLQLERTQARLAEMSSDLAEAVAARAELTKAIEKLTAKLPVNDQQNPHQA